MPRQVSTGQSFADSRRHMPYGKYRFLVEIDGFRLAGFHKCSGLEQKTEQRKYRDGGDNTTFHKGPGLTDYSDITLERGMSEDSDFVKWASNTHNLDGNLSNDPDYRRNLSIILQDHAGNEVKRWNVYECWVNNYKFDDFDAESNDNMLEYITICHEGFELV